MPHRTVVSVCCEKWGNKYRYTLTVPSMEHERTNLPVIDLLGETSISQPPCAVALKLMIQRHISTVSHRSPSCSAYHLTYHPLQPPIPALERTTNETKWTVPFQSDRSEKRIGFFSCAQPRWWTTATTQKENAHHIYLGSLMTNWMVTKGNLVHSFNEHFPRTIWELRRLAARSNGIKVLHSNRKIPEGKACRAVP